MKKHFLFLITLLTTSLCAVKEEIEEMPLEIIDRAPGRITFYSRDEQTFITLDQQIIKPYIREICALFELPYEENKHSFTFNNLTTKELKTLGCFIQEWYDLQNTQTPFSYHGKYLNHPDVFEKLLPLLKSHDRNEAYQILKTYLHKLQEKQNYMLLSNILFLFGFVVASYAGAKGDKITPFYYTGLYILMVVLYLGEKKSLHSRSIPTLEEKIAHLKKLLNGFDKTVPRLA